MHLTESDRRRIEDLQARYIRLIDDGRMEEWATLFTEYCQYRIVPRGASQALMECRGQAMLAEHVSGLAKIHVVEGERYSHQVSGLSVESYDGATATCRSNYLVIRSLRGEMDVFSAGVYVDRIALDQEGAQFEERIVVTDGLASDTLLVAPL